MAYTNDNLNSEELAELYNSEAKNIMFPENPVGYFIYKMYGHLEEDNLLFRMANANNIFLCDDIDLSKLGERYTITKPDGFTNFEYRLLIAFETFPVAYKAIMETVLKILFFDTVANPNDIYISSNVGNFKYSNMNKDNSLMSDQNILKDLMDTKTENFVIFLPDSVDKTSLCNVLRYLDLPYSVDGGCPDPVINVVLLPITKDYYNYVFYPDKIYDVSNLDNDYSIEIGSPDISKIIINNGNLVIDSDSYNRIGLINNHQFFVNGTHQGIVYNNSVVDNTLYYNQAIEIIENNWALFDSLTPIDEKISNAYTSHDGGFAVDYRNPNHLIFPTNTGYNIIDPVTNTIIESVSGFDGMTNRNSSVVLAPNGKYYVIRNGIIEIDIVNRTIVRVVPTGVEFEVGLLAKDGNIYLNTSANSNLYKYNIETKQLSNFTVPNISREQISIHLTSEGNILLPLTNGTACIFNVDTSNITPLNTSLPVKPEIRTSPCFDNKFYLQSYNNGDEGTGEIGILDIKNETYQTIDSTYRKSLGMCLFPDGSMRKLKTGMGGQSEAKYDRNTNTMVATVGLLYDWWGSPKSFKIFGDYGYYCYYRAEGGNSRGVVRMYSNTDMSSIYPAKNNKWWLPPDDLSKLPLSAFNILCNY